MKKINIVSFHSIKGGVGKTTVCLLTFLKLANSLRKENRGVSATDLANRLWVVDLDIGGRPMFYKPLSATENRDFTLLDILSSQLSAAKRRLSERGPYILCKDTSPKKNPRLEYSIELIRANNEQALEQALDEKKAKSAGLGRFLGVFLNDAVTHFNDASPTDYYRLVDRTLDLIRAETGAGLEEPKIDDAAPAREPDKTKPATDGTPEEPIWLLIDCPAGWQRTSRAVMHVIQDRLRWNASKAESMQPPELAWQPVWITTPDNYILTKSIEWLIEPKPGMPGFIPIHPTLLYNNMVRPLSGNTDKEHKSRTDLKLVTWALAQNDVIRRAFEMQGTYDRTSQQEVPLILPAISPIKDGPVDPWKQDVFAQAFGEQAMRLGHPARLPDGYCYSPPLRVVVPQTQQNQVPVFTPPADQEYAPAPQKTEKPKATKKVSAAERAAAMESALDAARIGGVAAARELPKALLYIQASPRAAKPKEIVTLAEAAAYYGMPDIAYAFYSVLRRKAEFMKDFGIVASYLRFLLENKYAMPDADPKAKSITPTTVARFYLNHFRDRLKGDFNYIYLDAFVGGAARAQELLNVIIPTLNKRRPEDLLIALSILPLVQAKEEAATKIVASSHSLIGNAVSANPQLALKVASALAPYVEVAHPFLATIVGWLYGGLKDTAYWTPANIRPWAVIAASKLHARYVARLWNDVYAMDRSDSVTINGFCEFLRLRKQTQLVRKVRAGKSLTKEDLAQIK